jgi:uncharacterized FlaG/YvyC family protein
MYEETREDAPFDLSILEKMQSDKPVAAYVKTTIGRVGVILLNPLNNRREERILQGDPRDSKTNRDDMTVKLYDERSHVFFKNMNKKLVESGVLAIDNNVGLPVIDLKNAITDEEIDEILEQPYFTLMNRLREFTSSFPIERVLRRALELNKTIKTLERIKERLAELQREEGLIDFEDKVDKHYKNLEPYDLGA